MSNETKAPLARALVLVGWGQLFGLYMEGSHHVQDWIDETGGTTDGRFPFDGCIDHEFRKADLAAMPIGVKVCDLNFVDAGPGDYTGDRGAREWELAASNWRDARDEDFGAWFIGDKVWSDVKDTCASDELPADETTSDLFNKEGSNNEIK